MYPRIIEIDDKVYNVSINLNPSDEQMTGNAVYGFYEIFESTMTEGSYFHKLICGEEGNKEVRSRGNWNVALVKINDKEIFIPYNNSMENENESIVFNTFSNEPHRFPNDLAVFNYLVIFLHVFVSEYYSSPVFKHFVEYLGGYEEVIRITTAFKYAAYGIEEYRWASFRILD